MSERPARDGERTQHGARLQTREARREAVRVPSRCAHGDEALQVGVVVGLEQLGTLVAVSVCELLRERGEAGDVHERERRVEPTPLRRVDGPCAEAPAEAAAEVDGAEIAAPRRTPHATVALLAPSPLGRPARAW